MQIPKKLSLNTVSSSAPSHKSIHRNRVFLFIAHGSREAKSNQAFFQLLQDYRKLFPREKVEGCFLEIAAPSIPEAIESAIKHGAQEIFLIPMMLFRGRHVQQDIPAMIQDAKAKHLEVDFHYASPLAEDPTFIQMMHRKVSAFSKPLASKKR